MLLNILKHTDPTIPADPTIRTVPTIETNSPQNVNSSQVKKLYSIISEPCQPVKAVPYLIETNQTHTLVPVALGHCWLFLS